jgi:hypothetical protein
MVSELPECVIAATKESRRLHKCKVSMCFGGEQPPQDRSSGGDGGLD